MVDPATAMLIATAVATAAKGAESYLGGKNQSKQAKRRAKEAKRETQASLLDDAMQRSAELEAHRLSGRQKSAKRSLSTSQNTSDLIRGALNI